MSDNEFKYCMSMDMNVLNHLGLNLYSNTSAVISEVVANSWDADATSVQITLSSDTIIIHDNGCGMSLNDINNKSMVVQRTNAELKKKLLEAEKICSDLKTEFIVIYEDWLNHEYSNASNENYEYLQFVIKNIFLAFNLP